MAHTYNVLRDKVGSIVAATVRQDVEVREFAEHARALGVLRGPFFTIDTTDEPPLLMYAMDAKTEAAIIADNA